MAKPKTKYWGQFWGKADDDDDWGDWEQGGKDAGSLDPERNKGKMGYMPEGWTDEQRQAIDHVICPDCGATVFASGYIVRDKCDVCWFMFPDASWNIPISKEAAKANKASQGTHTAYTGSYSKSLTSFAKLARSIVEPTTDKEDHLLSRIHMAEMPNRRWQEEVESNASGSSKSGVRDQTKHVTKQHAKIKTNADEYLSSTSEAYANEIAQDIELFARALELVVEAKGQDGHVDVGDRTSQEISDKQADLRRMIEVMMGEFGAATGHKIGDDWFLRDTTEEARAIQERAGSRYDQPMYGAALYGDEGEGSSLSEVTSKKSLNLSSDTAQYPTDDLASSKIREKIRQGIKKADVATDLDAVATEVAMAKQEDRMTVMKERLMPIISKILEEEGSEEVDQEAACDAIGEAMGGESDDGKERAEPADRDPTDGSYEETMRDYMNGVGDEIRKEREERAKKKSKEDKWSQTAKNIAKAYGHDSGKGYSHFDAVEPLVEFASKAPKTVPLNFKGQQMLEAIESERRVTWEESGDATDRMVELNFGNLKVFRQEDTYSPQLVIGVDVSGSTGCIHTAGGNDVYQDVGGLMWEIASVVSSVGSEANTQQYAYHSTHQGFLTAIEVPRGMRPVCNCEVIESPRYRSGEAREHGGGTPELAMLTYLNDKAQQSGELSSTTVILIVDGQPDDEEACKKMSEQLVAAGVQFGVVVCGNDNYFDEEEENYYSASVAVKVRNSSEIDTAIPKLMSLIRARGLA
jgi:hypothetical protein